LAQPTSQDSTTASASALTPRSASSGRVFSMQLLTSATLTPRERRI
jgi:hypothetical protein